MKKVFKSSSSSPGDVKLNRENRKGSGWVGEDWRVKTKVSIEDETAYVPD